MDSTSVARAVRSMKLSMRKRKRNQELKEEKIRVKRGISSFLNHSLQIMKYS